MIPIRLSFSGIRNYEDTTINLQGAGESLLITGPNGAGKSTIAHCVSAVLSHHYVPLESFRPYKLPKDGSWHASISLIFKLNNMSQPYVQFTLLLEQPEEKGPIKKEYQISSGNQLDRWQEKTIYTSNGMPNNFVAYKKQIECKYNVKPELLIFHQQLINQYTVMEPAKRFQQFCQLYKMDHLLEEYGERVKSNKRSRDRIQILTSTVQLMSRQLKAKERAVTYQFDKQEQQYSELYHYTLSLMKLKMMLKQKTDEKNVQINDKSIELQDKQSQLLVFENQLNFLWKVKKSVKADYSDYESKLKSDQHMIAKLVQSIEEKKIKLKQCKHSPRYPFWTTSITSIQELETKFHQLEVQHHKTKQEIDRLNKTLIEKQQVFEEYLTDLIQYKQANKAARMYEEIIRNNQNEEEIVRMIKGNEQKISELNEELLQLKLPYKQMQNEVYMLENDQVRSKRQLKSLRYLKEHHIPAYPLSDLIELDETATAKEEHLYNTCKYTIFFHGTEINPPTDLYHVPLMKIIPQKPIFHLPSLHVRIKQNIADELQPFAMKAMWWLKQLFENQQIEITGRKMTDSFGIRGMQEKETPILHKKAKERRLRELNRMIQRHDREMKQVDARLNDYKTETEACYKQLLRIREALTMLDKFKWASSADFMKLQEKKLTKVKLEIQELHSQLNQMTVKSSGRMNEMAYIKEMIILAGAQDEQKRGIEHRKRKEKNLLKIIRAQHVRRKKHFLNIKKKGTMHQRVHDRIRDKARELKLEIEGIVKFMNSERDQIDRLESELIKTNNDLHHIQHVMPLFFEEIKSKRIHMEPNQNIDLIRSMREKGRGLVLLSKKDQEKNKSAEKLYESLKEEKERIVLELRDLHAQLEKEESDERELQQLLNTSIKEKIKAINVYFIRYLNRFNITGHVWIEEKIDRHMQPYFELYFSIGDKMGNYKTTEHVSGGESTLYSLLFGLAMLEGASINKAFILLDEFDQSLDNEKKIKALHLFMEEISDKLIVITPTVLQDDLIANFQAVYVIHHDPHWKTSKALRMIHSSKRQLNEN